MNSSFPNRWSFSYLKFTKYVTNIIAEPKYKYGQQNKYSKEPQQKYRLETVSIKILGGLNRFYGYPTSPSASVMAQNIQLFGPHEGFLAHQWIITGNKQRKKNFIMKQRWGLDRKVLRQTHGRSRGCRATPWNTGAKENQQLNPGGPSNGQKSSAPNQLK